MSHLDKAQNEGFSYLTLATDIAAVNEVIKTGPFYGFVVLDITGGDPAATVTFQRSQDQIPLPLQVGFSYMNQGGWLENFVLNSSAVVGGEIRLLLVRDPLVAIRLANESVNVEVSGVAPQMDDTDKIAVSVYGRSNFAGDTPILSNNSGRLLNAPSVEAAAADGTSNFFSLLTNSADGNRLLGVGGSAYNSATWDRLRTVQIGDAQLTGVLAVSQYDFNGSNHDRHRGNINGTPLPLAARTAQTVSPDQTNYNGAGLIIIVNVTVDPALASITPSLRYKLPTGGAFVTFWTAAAPLTATGVYSYIFARGLDATAGAFASYTEARNILIPRDWLFRMNVADADSMTYGVDSVHVNI